MNHLTAPLPATSWWGRFYRTRTLKVLAGSAVLLVSLAAVFHFCGDALLNRFLRPEFERACSAHLPGCAVQLGPVRYDAWRNCLTCDSTAVTRTDGECSLGSTSATGVQWFRLLLGSAQRAQMFSRAQFELNDFSALLPGAEYRVHFGHLRLSVPDSICAAQDVSIQLVGSDEAFFASTPFRRVRYRLSIASCLLHGVDVPALLAGQSYRAQSVELSRPVLEALVNREKPRRPLLRPPMPHEILAAIGQPFRIDHLTIKDGVIKYAARRFDGAEPGVLSFTSVQISAQEIANAAAGGHVIGLLAEGRLMDAGTLTVQMRLPVAPSSLAFHYSGKLTGMDLTRLDDYMDGAGRVQIKSGRVDGAWFDIDVAAGHARGTVRGVYQDLQVKVVDLDTGSERGVVNRAATVLANVLKVRNENVPDQAGALKAGKVDYARHPEETFPQFAWLALRTGILDLVSLQAGPIP